MKRIICLILALLMLTPTAFADTTPQMTYRLKAESGEIGDVVKLVLSVEDAPACAAYETTITYDPAVLQPTGDYQKMYLNGLMVVNTEAEIDGKKMIKVAAVAVKGNLLEGTMDLLNVSFKIIGMPEDPKGSAIDVYDYTFSQNDEKLTPVPTLLLIPARVQVAEGDASAMPEEDPAPTPEKEEEKKEEDPKADWYFDGDQAIEYYPDNSQDSVQYDVEYEKDEEGNTTGVILYDKEDKTQAGRLEVEEDEYGNLNVTDKQMNDEKEKPFSPWFLLPIGAAVLIAVGGVILAIKTKKKK